MFTLEQAWTLARAWYEDDRRAAGWRRKTMEEAIAIFGRAGLTGPFWAL